MRVLVLFSSISPSKSAIVVSKPWFHAYWAHNPTCLSDDFRFDWFLDLLDWSWLRPSTLRSLLYLLAAVGVVSCIPLLKFKWERSEEKELSNKKIKTQILLINDKSKPSLLENNVQIIYTCFLCSLISNNG